MDMLIHYGVITRIDHQKVKVKTWVLKLSIALDAIILGGLLYVKAKSDVTILWVALASMVGIYFYERYFLQKKSH